MNATTASSPPAGPIVVCGTPEIPPESDRPATTTVPDGVTAIDGCSAWTQFRFIVRPGMFVVFAIDPAGVTFATNTSPSARREASTYAAPSGPIATSCAIPPAPIAHCTEPAALIFITEAPVAGIPLPRTLIVPAT